MNVETPVLSMEQSEALSRLAETTNEKLESAGQNAANQAFNLGCSVSLIPGLLLVLLAFFLSRASWVVAAVAGMLVLVAMLVFANLAAFTAKNRTIEQTYQRDILPEIERYLRQMNVSRPSFDRISDQILPSGAILRRYLSVPIETEDSSNDEIP